MIYLSKGIAAEKLTREEMQVIRGGESFYLSGEDAEIWQKGRFQFTLVNDAGSRHVVQRLTKLGLAENEEEDSAEARYRILTRCLCCPAETEENRTELPSEEAKILCWLENAGIRLTTAELVFLMEHQIEPAPELLYEENSQALVETIYASGNISDNMLEEQMALAGCRDRAVNFLLGLLQKKRILIL